MGGGCRAGASRRRRALAIEMVATVLPVWVVRRWTSGVRRPLPVRVSIAETSWVPGGRGLMEPGAAGRLVGVARTHAPASRRGSAVGGLSAGKLVRRILAASASGRRCYGVGTPRPRGTVEVCGALGCRCGRVVGGRDARRRLVAGSAFAWEYARRLNGVLLVVEAQEDASVGGARAGSSSPARRGSGVWTLPAARHSRAGAPGGSCSLCATVGCVSGEVSVREL